MLTTNLDESGASNLRVVGLSEYRGQRRNRMRIARALHAADPVRDVLARYLGDLALLTDSDRAAAVWVDEYEGTQIHPHVVLDLLDDRPRRDFSLTPIERAWDEGIPGLYETSSEDVRDQFERGSSIAVSLGSDGVRAWFLIADSVSPRGRLPADVRERTLYIAGECSAAVLHRDLDRGLPRDGAAQRQFARGFAGWTVLEDFEGREDSAADTARIEQRFSVVRTVRGLIDDDFTPRGDSWREQIEMIRNEVSKRISAGGDPLALWAPVLDAAFAEHLPDLSRSLLALGEHAESIGHRYGALELYRCAMDVAAAAAEPAVAVDAARFQGRIHRRLAQWDDSARAYRVAYDIATESGLWAVAAQVLTGLASVRQENGNLPAARAEAQKALELAERSGDADALATVHHGMLSLEQASGRLSIALEHGWKAVSSYNSVRGRIRCLAGLAGVLEELGDCSAAEDAWTIVARQSDEIYYRTYALDALAYLAALRSDIEEFKHYAAACDALDWRNGSPATKAEILIYRGLSYKALGLHDTAERWLQEAVDFADATGFNRRLFQAEDALRDLRQGRRTSLAADSAIHVKTPAAPPEVRTGLREMRQALVSASP